MTFAVQAATHPAAKHVTLAEVRTEHAARDWLRRMLDAGPRHLVYRCVEMLTDGTEGLPIAVADLQPYALRRRPRVAGPEPGGDR